MQYILIFILSVFISSCSQILLKKSAQEEHENKLKEYLNVKVILAYGMFFLSSLVTIIAYRYVPLSMGPILEASGYIYVAVLGYLVLKETISKRKLVGLVIILSGIVLFNL